MQPQFLVKREQKNKLDYGDSRSANVPLHFHSAIELRIITEGEMEVWINDRRRVLKVGELSVALSYDAHAYRSREGSASCYLIVPTDDCREFLAALGDRRPGNPFISDPATFETVLQCHHAMQKSSNSLQLQGYLNVLLGTLLEQFSPELQEIKKDPDLSTRILLYLNEHYKTDLTLPDLAAALGYNPSYLSRFFKANFQISFNRYLTMLRLREAVLLMKEPQNTIAFCAYESGFSSIRTFYRAFCEEFHCTPKQYRSTHSGRFH